MTNFQQDVIKLVIDKALLGVVAAVFGYYLSRLLENHRAKNAHRLFVVQQRIESMKACWLLLARITSIFQTCTKWSDAFWRSTAAARKPANRISKPGADTLTSTTRREASS